MSCCHLSANKKKKKNPTCIHTAAIRHAPHSGPLNLASCSTVASGPLDTKLATSTVCYRYTEKAFCSCGVFFPSPGRPQCSNREGRKGSKVSSPNHPASSYQCQASFHCCIPAAAEHHPAEPSHPFLSEQLEKERPHCCSKGRTSHF